MKVLIISPDPWGINFVSKHHYAQALARLGFSVFFLNPPRSAFAREEIEPNLVVLSYRVTFRGLNRLPVFLRKVLMRIEVQRLRRYFQIEDLDLVWSFDPFRFQDLALFKAKKSIYQSVDWHRTARERDITLSADLLLVTSAILKKRLSNWRPEEEVHNIGHGLAEHFLSTHTNSVRKEIKVGLVGNLAYPFLDTATLLDILKANKDVTFHFVGPETSNLGKGNTDHWIKEAKSLANVSFLGPYKSEELPDVLAQFDFFLICYDTTKYREHLGNPHKVLEYLSTGKAVVSHFISEYENKELLLMVEDNDHLPAFFRSVVENLELYNAEPLIKKRLSFAQANTYKMKVKQIFELLEHVPG